MRFLVPADFPYPMVISRVRIVIALGAVTFFRSLAGFGFPLFAPSMYRTLGFGKGDTILAVIAIVFGCPA
jgi:hypothetical protein